MIYFLNKKAKMIKDDSLESVGEIKPIFYFVDIRRFECLGFMIKIKGRRPSPQSKMSDDQMGLSPWYYHGLQPV